MSRASLPFPPAPHLPFLSTLQYGYSPLHDAALTGNQAMVESLLQANANVNQKNHVRASSPLISPSFLAQSQLRQLRFS